MQIDSREFHDSFRFSKRKHILNITNHGIHQWDIIPGLTDTGGQNVFVNQFSDALVQQGYKVTIINRGGYPHPVTGEMRRGLHYKNAFQRLFFLEDSLPEFVRKEDMAEHVPALAAALKMFIDEDGSNPDLIISHYWDAAEIGIAYNQYLTEPIRHIWVPHSLGIYKKQNVPPESWENLRVDERIVAEKELIQRLDGIGATSAMIRDMLLEDYDYKGPIYWLPPCIDTSYFYPRRVSDQDEIWKFLGSKVGLKPEQVRARKIVTEVSRTVANKRKDVLIRAFARAHQAYPDTLLVVSIDEREAELSQQLRKLIQDEDVQAHTIVVGSIWDILPKLYAVTDIFCTPSVVEGFGMTAQEAAATKVPVVASDGVPFATEYLLGESVNEVMQADPEKDALKIGEGAIVVAADDVEGFAGALRLLLEDNELRQNMGERAYQITIPAFTWERVVRDFMDQIDV